VPRPASRTVPYLTGVLTCLALSTTPAPSHAGTGLTGDDSLTVTVSYAGLDLSSPAGAKILYEKLKRAAELVCAPLEGRVALHARWASCYDNALSNGVLKINSEELTALDRSRRRGKSPAVRYSETSSDQPR
jgi:UrcA family protein